MLFKDPAQGFEALPILLAEARFDGAVDVEHADHLPAAVQRNDDLRARGAVAGDIVVAMFLPANWHQSYHRHRHHTLSATVAGLPS